MEGVSALNATIGIVTCIALDVANNVLYIADNSYKKIRSLNLVTNIVTTFAGNGTSMYGGDDGPAASAAFKSVTSIALDSTNRKLYVADSNAYVVRVIDLTTNIITTIAGTGVSGYSGDSGDAKLAKFKSTSGLAVDPTTNSLYISDSTNSRVRKVALNNTRQISVFVGTGTATNTKDGGPAINATIKNPTSVAVDTANNLVYIAAGGVIRVVNRSDGKINLAAGTTTTGYNGDGNATNTKLSTIGNIVIDAVHNQVIFSDSARVRIIASGNVTTIVGVSYYGDGGPALRAQLDNPLGMVLGTNNMLYVSDTNHNVVRAISRTTNVITTIAGKI
jgi:hypothetical protein